MGNGLQIARIRVRGSNRTRGWAYLHTWFNVVRDVIRGVFGLWIRNDFSWLDVTLELTED